MKRLKPTNKILIAMPFWAGDKNLAMHLSKLLADLEPKHSDFADFLFISRFDCAHDQKMVKYVSRKFNTHTCISKRRTVGWPSGCNGMFFGLMEWVYYKMESGQIPHYKAIYLMGADGVPLRQNWIEYLHNQWDGLNRQKKIYMAGALILDEHTSRGNDHINGDCALLSGDLSFLKWIVRTVVDVTAPAGWDWVLAGEFKQWGWANIPGIRSYWRFPRAFTDEDWKAQVADEVVWVHGIKDDSLLKVCRKQLLGGV